MLPHKPGVYRFLDKYQKILYVGKATDLKKRVSQYYRKNITDQKTLALMSHVVRVEYTVTENENQALLLECALIKAHRPKYNILMRDDKSYPYLFLSQHNFPMLGYRRGKKKKEKGKYFGPYPTAGSVRDNLALLQKLFQLRNCTDTFFSHRSRPCLQYQIGRCTAPCVKYVSKENYALQVKDAVDFLAGKNKALIRDIQHRMKTASAEKNYERAAHWRDLLQQLRSLAIAPQERAWVQQVEDQLDRKYSASSRTRTRFHALQKILGLPKIPERIECFDISHTQGVAIKAACVVFDATGPVKNEYRQFNITEITRGDDYAAMEQVLTRRYRRTRKAPDVVIVDGGKGQLNVAARILTELKLSDTVLMGVAKGVSRKAGKEHIFIFGKDELYLPNEDLVRLLIQEVRDEAHRFAIQAHRKQRGKLMIGKK